MASILDILRGGLTKKGVVDSNNDVTFTANPQQLVDTFKAAIGQTKAPTYSANADSSIPYLGAGEDTAEPAPAVDSSLEGNPNSEAPSQLVAGTTEQAPDPTTFSQATAAQGRAPQIIQPSFAQASQDRYGNVTHGASPALTKLGLFAKVLKGGIQGGTDAVEGGALDAVPGRSNFGAGMSAAQTMPLVRQQRQLGAQRGQIENDMLQANTQPVNTPWGPMPMFRAKAMADYQAKLGDANKDRFVTPRNGGVYDTMSGSFAPGTEPVDKKQNVSAQQLYADTVQGAMQRGLTGDALLKDPQVQSALQAYQAIQKTTNEKPDNLDQQYLDAATKGDAATMSNIEKVWKAKATNVHVNTGAANDVAPEDFETLVQALLKGSIDPKSAFGRGGTQLRAKALAEASRRDPNFSMADYPLRQQAYQYFFGNGKGADQIQSANTLIQHSKDLSDVVNNYRLTSSPLLNRPLNWIQKNSGEAEYSAYMAALQPVRDEFMTYLQNNHALTNEDRKAGDVILSDNASPAQQQSAIKQLSHTAALRLGENNNRYRRVFGQDYPELLGPDSAQFLKDVGAYDSVYKNRVNGKATVGGGAEKKSGSGKYSQPNGDNITFIPIG